MSSGLAMSVPSAAIEAGRSLQQLPKGISGEERKVRVA
jgi:hypothetical protein